MITISGLNKSFGETGAIRALDLSVKTGEIFGIVGPDGAGKSTLLRMIAAIMKPQSGTIAMNGVDVFADPYRTKENLAYMPQQFGLYEDLTVEENLYFFGRLFGVRSKKIKERLVRLYEFSNLEPFKDRLAGKLSGGMKQKLGLACCLIHQPKLLLLDEPTNGVDPVSRREFWKILYDLLSESVTIIVSTAYLDEAERCNRIAFLYDGEIITLGEPKSIRASLKSTMIEILACDSRRVETLLSREGIKGPMIRSGNSLKIFTDKPAMARASIKKILQHKKIAVVSIREALPTLEDSFIEIISQEKNQ